MRLIGIFGCGNIARLIAQQAADLKVTAAYDRHADRRSALSVITLLGNLDNAFVLGA